MKFLALLDIEIGKYGHWKHGYSPIVDGKLTWKPIIDFDKYCGFLIGENNKECLKYKTISKQQARKIANYD